MEMTEKPIPSLPQIFANFFNSPDTSNHKVGFEMLKGFNEKDIYTFAEKYYGKLLTSKVGNWKELLSLQRLYLHNNQLTSLPAEIGKLVSLQTLYLDNNPISKAEQKRIKKLLPNCEVYF